MNYAGKPHHSMPSKRYDLFIKAYEKHVSKVQEEIAKLDRLSRPYEIVQLALEAANLDNDINLVLALDNVKVVIRVLDDDQEEKFLPLLASIGAGLVEWRLHSDGLYSTTNLGYDLYYQWQLKTLEPRAWIEIRLDVPLEGTKYILIKKEPRQRIYNDYNVSVEWRKLPSAE